MTAASPARPKGGSIVLLAVALLVSVHVIWQAWLVAAAPYPAHYDYDEGVYGETAGAAAAGGRLYATVFLSQPPLLIGVLVHTFAAFGRSLASARGVAVGFSALWLASLAAIAAFGGRPRTAVWAVVIAGSAPAFVAASHTVQMEGPSEALGTLAVALALAGSGVLGRRTAAGRLDRAWWGIAGLAAGLAVMTKFTAATCFVPLAVTIAAADPTFSFRRAAGRTAALAAGGLLAAGAVIAWTDSPPAEMWRQAVAFHGVIARVTAVDPGRAAFLLRDFAAANWFLTAVGLAGLAVAVGAWRAATGRIGAALPVPIAAWLAADLTAVFLWRPVWPHHLAILVTPLALLGAGAVEASRRLARQTGAAGTLAAGALLVCWLPAVWGTVAATVPENSGSVRAAVLQTKQMVPDGGWIVADDPMIPFLAGRDAPPALCDTSEMRMRAGWLTGTVLTAALDEPRVRGVVLWRGTFRRAFPHFAGDASQRFPRRWIAGDGREILAR